MILAGYLSTGASGPETAVGLLATAAIVGYALCRWLGRPAQTPEPWGQQVAEELEHDDCTPLCHHCLEPHVVLANFCPNCGASVNPCGNLMPNLYPFAFGHGLRVGTTENFKKSPLTIVGFPLLAGCSFWLAPGIGLILAPFYLARFFQNLFHPEQPSPPPDDNSTEPLPGSGAQS